MVQVVKVSPAAVPDVQISVRIHAGVATIRLKGSDVAFLRLLRSQPRTGSRDCTLGAGLLFMALPLQNAGGSVAVFSLIKPQPSSSNGAFCVFGLADPAKPVGWSLWIT